MTGPWQTSSMDPLRSLCEQIGFFTRSHARDVGYDDKAMSAMMRGRVWHRVRRGYYTFGDIWARLDEVDRHLITCRCVLDALGPRVALSHVSGAVAHGIRTWNIPLSVVQVTRLDRGAGRLEARVLHHLGGCTDAEVTEVDGMRVLSPERCAIEAGSMTTGEGALVVFDSALHQGRCNEHQLRQQFEAMAAWPRTRHLHIPVRMADASVESPGESRGRWLFWTFGLPAPQCQFEVHHVDGSLAGVCDWGWPEHRVLGEFDGRIKYGRLLKPTQEPGDVVFAEKQREDLLREMTGFTMVRLTWGDFDRPRLTAARVERMLRGAA